MSFALPFTAAAKAKKEAKAVLAAARTFVLSYEDLPAYRAGGDKASLLQNLREAWSAKNVPECRSLLELLDPPKSFAFGREWLDILVVSISVAMAFRAYFYEPFNIPTGSMQPTLYGNYSRKCSPAQATFWDKGPQKWLKWALTGEMYECFVAPCDGQVNFHPTNTGHYDMRVVNPMTGAVSKPMLVPTDVLRGSGGDAPVAVEVPTLPNGLHPGDYVRAGQVLWSGYVVTGDFLFVNRWLWNFRHPRRGDVMIFSTTGIEGLAQGTHYIKRMTGTPGETLTVKGGHLLVNGEQPMTPRRVAQIQNREKGEAHMYAYAGYRPSGAPSYDKPGRTICREGDEVKLAADEYYACGDNSPNSYDSRYWGPVPARNLCGIAGGVFWPIVNPRWGTIE